MQSTQIDSIDTNISNEVVIESFCIQANDYVLVCLLNNSQDNLLICHFVYFMGDCLAHLSEEVGET
jgi:hypothetical protein